MSRVEKFELFKDCLIHKKLYFRLSQAELQICRDFLTQTADLNKADFTLKVNRWFLDQPKPKNYSAMWALVSQSS